MIFLILWAALVAANGDCPVKPEGFREGQLFRIDPGPASSRVVFGLAGEISKEKARLFANARAVGYVYIQHSRELEGVLHRLGRLDADVLLAWPAQEENVVLSGTESSPCRSPGLVVAPVRDFLAGNILSINRTCSTARIFDSGTVYCQAYHYQLHQGWKRMEEARLKRISIAGSSWAEVAAVVTSSFRGFLNVPGWFDDVKPLSLSGSNWLGGRATLWDSISTLLIAADEDSYAMAREKALSEGVPCSILPTHVFEYHIRVLGGLLGAYSLSGDPLWLQGAKVAAEMMLQGPFSPFVLPLRRAPIVPPMTLLAMALSAWEGLDRKPVGKSTYRINSLAGVGTYALEFEALSRETGDMRYSDTASQIHRILAKVAGKQPTLVRYTGLDVGWPPVQGCDSESGPLGAGADSFYEYLLKVPLLLQKNANREGLDKISQHRLAWFQRILPSIYSQIEKSSGLPTESCRPTEVCTRKFAHLLCFLPGLLAISENATAMESAKGMARALIRLYDGTATGLGPEEVILNGGTRKVMDPSFQLRPELIESLAILWGVTGEDEWRAAALTIWERLKRHCLLENGMLVGIADVYNLSSAKIDEQPSFSLAETLKYLLLAFDSGPDSPYNAKNVLNDFVLSTEGHPLRRHGIHLPLCEGDPGALENPCIVASRISGQLQLKPALPWLQHMAEWTVRVLLACLGALLLLLLFFSWRLCMESRKKSKVD